jgi:hypothetical protein
MAAIGKHLVGMLLGIIEDGADPPRRLVFPQELVIQQSWLDWLRCAAGAPYAVQDAAPHGKPRPSTR